MFAKSSRVVLVLLIVFASSLSSSTRKDEVRRNGSIVLEGKIVGGTPVSIEKCPSAVVLYNYGGMCGATILNGWTVLTAGHCFMFNEDVNEMTVQVGATYTYDISAKLHKVDNLKIHPKYGKAMQFACDIALVFLASPIKFGPKAKKVVLANTDVWMNEKETNFEVSGWGVTQYKGKTSEQGLLMARLRYINRRRCSLFHNVDFTEDMFCLYGDAERDSCNGDSGGGVMWNGQMVGIVSHGDRCAEKDKPSVYSNVWYFRPWIEKNVKDYIETHCQK